ncbi:GNAT family N-acetyltransferase [Winogradskyella sp. PG-2]|uniref:GNAT family N-acetyltransferase n=1 Tax=Winogradskyella sp. PG-2 TaxID=754409 RepID=UPI0004587773|nr:GNAT family N-acetyltransferase [Winogradskyella sp. PG-2]BAO75056.1 putative ribosomal-protein-serine acetyltransferase [Winogradskyella sp. PG-2]
MNSYKVLHNQVFSNDEFSIVPIRYEDRMDILKWRNEQIYHLRQDKPLTRENQEVYFKSVVSELFSKESPSQILFSYMENDACIGYGGLVHINWVDKHAEISFIMNTILEQDYFSKHWTIFLKLIEEVAFKELQLHKLVTYAFDLRPHLYEIIENAGFVREAVLKEHCLFNDSYLDVIMHGKINKVNVSKA